MSDEEKKTLIEELSQFREAFAEAGRREDEEAEEYWNSLDKETQMKAFHAVVKRIVKGELQDRGSYRYVLYDVFGFGMESYLMGMNCGYMELHNSIIKDE